MWQQAWQAGNRQNLLQRLNNKPEHWDLIVAGGGITGAASPGKRPGVD